MSAILRCALAALFAIGLAGRLSAHFVFVHVVLGAKPRVEVHFAEGAWDFSADQRMVSFLAKLQSALPNGEQLEFEARPFGYVAALPESERTIGTHLTFGVIDRGGEFLLEYDAKGVAKLEDASKSCGLTAELFAKKLASGKLELEVKFQGNPAPGAEVVVPVAGSTLTETFETDENGKLRIDAPRTALFSIRAMVAEEREGELDGKSFSLVKHYTTLTVHQFAAAVPRGSDGLAWALMTDAALCNAASPLGAMNATGDIRVSMKSAADSASISGEVKLAGGRAVVSWAGGATDTFGAASAIDSMMRPIDLWSSGDAPVRFAKRNSAQLGAELEVGDGLRLWLKDRQVEAMERSSNGIVERFDAMEYGLSHTDRFLPESFVVTTRSSGDGSILSVELCEQSYEELAGGYVATRRTSKRILGGGLVETRVLRLSGLEVADSGGER